MPYSSIDRVREADGFDTHDYPDELVSSALTWAEAVVDHITVTSWEHKPFEVRAVCFHSAELWLDVLFPQQLHHAVDLRTGSPVDVSGWRLNPHTSRVYLPTVRTGEWLVAGLAGETDTPPEDIAFATTVLARHWLTNLNSRVPERAVSAQSEYGQIIFATASHRRPTGLPDVDAILLRHSHRAPGTA
ncbi:hypothetical protein GCM10012275_56300 [Longimycelium tulufanense]|uniref:Uncharacterized protein n=1 Tax=Longimycelium tulufanense TaxID=907463 RepID=A0A8J3CDJ4_9PSEU|nr:hypothetical protein [Longimycelium tulufanense]GGM78423.1 hypothetical protein GCM10012275_56300 [Longimycelium tulufanense]